MNKKEINYLIYISTLDLNSYEYKILLLLLDKPLTQTSLADKLSSSRQYINKCVKDLEVKELINVDREEGRHKFYRAVNNRPREVIKVINHFINPKASLTDTLSVNII